MADTSTLFGMLAAAPRRRLLFMLCETETVDVPEGLRTRSEASAPQTTAGPAPGPSVREVDEFELRLHHTHLPKLEQEGLVDWDRERDTVSRGPAFEEAEPLLRLLAANARDLSLDLF